MKRKSCFKSLSLLNIFFVFQILFLLQVSAKADVFVLGDCGSTWAQRLGIRDHYGGANFSEYCREHDLCYESCGKDKEYCDRKFKTGMRRECKDTYNNRFHVIQRKLCLEAANTYHSSVHRLGGDAYRNAQKSCTIEDKVSNANDSRMENFIKIDKKDESPWLPIVINYLIN